MRIEETPSFQKQLEVSRKKNQVKCGEEAKGKMEKLKYTCSYNNAKLTKMIPAIAAKIYFI